MKIIKAGYELITAVEGPSNIMKHIEKIGRVCYKSEDKITKVSSKKFITNLAERKHWAMLEHHIFVMNIPKDIFEDIKHVRWYKYPDIIDKLKYINLTSHRDGKNTIYLVSGSATSFNNLYWCDGFKSYDNSGISELWKFLKSYVPDMMISPVKTIKQLKYDPFSIDILSQDEIDELPLEIKLTHKYFSVLFTVDRGVTHELVRHRPASWAQESTRYCDYSKDKHDNEITFIEPSFFLKDPEKYSIWETTCFEAEQAYMEMKRKGCTAQEARSILPHSVKADIVMTATLREWRHFFKMRVPKTAHPQMREVTVPLLMEAISTFPGIFDDIEKLIEKGVS